MCALTTAPLSSGGVLCVVVRLSAVVSCCAVWRYFDVVDVGEEHGEPVDAHSPAGGGRQPVVQRDTEADTNRYTRRRGGENQAQATAGVNQARLAG